MPVQFKQFGLAIISLSLLTASVGDASAGCTRHVYNRSSYILVGHQDGGPSFAVRPGAAKAVRLARPGAFTLTAYCPARSRGRMAADAGTAVAEARMSYEAVLDKCFVEIGDGLFESELGRGFIGTKDPKPFTVNNPQQGDIILGPFSAACPT